MTPEIAKIVGQKEQPKALLDFAQTVKDLITMSRNEMSKNYEKWDMYDAVYRGERTADVDDKKANERGEPVKQILPMALPQIQTFVSFGVSLYNQRDWYYEMIASGQEDEGAAKIATALLEQNLTHNKYRQVQLREKLTDIGRWGMGITKESWVKEQVPYVTEVPDDSQLATDATRADLAAPVEPKMKKVVQYRTKYLGNKIVNISPYRWFPDTRLPLTRWAEGEFCGDEIEEATSKLEMLERDGLIAGLEFVTDLTQDSVKNRKLSFLGSINSSPMTTAATAKAYKLVTEVQIRLNPSKTLIDEKMPLGIEDCTKIYIVWILNDDRIVRISEAGYDHEEFGYNCGLLFDDQNQPTSMSLSEILSALQDTATWFLNSRVTSVRKSIFYQAVVDPSGVEVDDILKRRPLIRLKQGRAGSGVEQWYKQITNQDVTQNHINDIGVLSSLAKEATGINETLLGQFSSGRRSAKEASNVANYAAARLVVMFGSIWESSEAPMGRKMLSNLRQGLDEPTLVRMYGQINTQQEAQAAVQLVPALNPQMQMAPAFQMKQVTKDQLVGNYDFNVFNGTLPSQRQATASVLMEWLQTALKDPRVVLVTGLDPQLVAYEVFELLGIRNVQRFRLTPERLQQFMLMAQPPPNPGRNKPAPNGGGQP